MSDLAQKLSEFSGTERYHRHWCGSTIYLTDRVNYLAEQAQAYWLMDIIASAYPYYKHDEFVVVRLAKTDPQDPNDHSARVTIARDYSQPPYYTQHIHYTDFPLAQITLYAALGGLSEDDQNPRYVVMLPSEY